MKLHGVRPALAVAVFAAAVLAACGGGGGGAVPGGGGGGGGGGATPTPVPTATPAPGYAPPAGGVTQLTPTAANLFASSMLTASTDGTFLVQSTDTPSEAAAGTTLPEYDVTATETAGGQVPGSTTRNPRGVQGVVPPERSAMPSDWQRFDPRTSTLTRRAATMHSRMTRSRVTQSVRAPSSFSVGSHRVFHVLQGAITGVSSSCNLPKQSAGGECYLDVPATVQAVSNNAYVWVEDAVTADPNFNFSTTDWTTTGTTFDTAYTRETAAFGAAFFTHTNEYDECDGTGHDVGAPTHPVVDLTGADPHVSILITNALAAAGEGGYFDPRNFANDQQWNCAAQGAHAPSNQLPMFIIGADKYGSSTDENFWRTMDMPRSVAHEFQHYLHTLNKVWLPELKNNVQGYYDDAVVDEGCSELAEDLVLGTGVNSPQSWESRLDSFFYLIAAGNFSVPSFTGYDADPLSNATNPPYAFFHNTAGSYGGAYLLARYMYDRFGGDLATHRLYADLSPPPSGHANLHPLVAEANNGETFAQLYAEFAAALAARNVASSDPRFTFASNVLLRGTWSFTYLGGAPYNALFNGPRSPEDLTNTSPGSVARIKLTPTSTVHVKLISGATLFFNVAPSGGSLVELTATSAPGVSGSLVQGSYDDSASCVGPASQCHP